MQDFIREYGKYIIAVCSFMIIMGLLVSAALFPQYGLLSYLGDKSRIEADHLDGDYMISVDENGIPVTLYENKEITFELMAVPVMGEELHVNFNKGKDLFPNSCLIKTNNDNAELTIISIKNNNKEDALDTIINTDNGQKPQAEYIHYDYNNESDDKDNYKNDDGYIIFNEPGVYSITVQAKWDNGNGEGYSVRDKAFKIRVFKDNSNIFTGHQYTGYIVDKEPTCEENGVKSLHCLLEGHEDERFEEETIPALGHDWDTTPTVKWADDGKTATLTYKCKRDPSHTRQITARSTASIKIQPTCTGKGTTTYTLNVTDPITNTRFTASTDRQDINASGHSATQNPQAKYLKTAATCTTSAAYYYSCSKCGYKYTYAFLYGNPLGHSYETAQYRDNMWDDSYLKTIMLVATKTEDYEKNVYLGGRLWHRAGEHIFSTFDSTRTYSDTHFDDDVARGSEDLQIRGTINVEQCTRCQHISGKYNASINHGYGNGSGQNIRNASLAYKYSGTEFEDEKWTGNSFMVASSDMATYLTVSMPGKYTDKYYINYGNAPYDWTKNKTSYSYAVCNIVGKNLGNVIDRENLQYHFARFIIYFDDITKYKSQQCALDMQNNNELSYKSIDDKKCVVY